MSSKIQALKPITDAAMYDPKAGWRTTAQPEQGCSNSEYIAIAQDAVNDLIDKQDTFLNKHGYSYVRISHNDFLKFENGPQTFRSWFNQHCDENNLDSDVDVCLIEPCVKSHESADRKTATGSMEPDRVVDYLRCMDIILKKSPKSKRNKASLDVLENFIKDIENYQETIARKNYFFIPHEKTGMRASKALWTAKAEKGSEYEGYEVLAENKVEHESQMDIDKLTRNFMNEGRRSQVFMSTVFSKCVGAKGSDQDHKTARAHSVRSAKLDKKLTNLGIALYHRINQDAGLNQTRFVNPQLLDKLTPLPIEKILEKIETEIRKLPSGRQTFLREKLQVSNLFPQNSIYGYNKLDLA